MGLSPDALGKAAGNMDHSAGEALTIVCRTHEFFVWPRNYSAPGHIATRRISIVRIEYVDVLRTEPGTLVHSARSAICPVLDLIQVHPSGDRPASVRSPPTRPCRGAPTP